MNFNKNQESLTYKWTSLRPLANVFPYKKFVS